MERSASENRNKSSDDGGAVSSKESSRSSSKDKQRSSTPKEKESEKSVAKRSHRSSRTDCGASSKSHPKSSSKGKDEKGTSAEEVQKASSSHRSSSKEDSKSSHSKHKAEDTKHGDSKSSHRSSKEKSESSSKQSHRSSSKDDGKSSSRHGHRSSDHKHSTSSSKIAGTEQKAKHSDKLPVRDNLKANPKESSDKSSRSHASHKDSELKNVDESKSSKGHEHVKVPSSADSKNHEPSKHSHRSSSKSDKTSSDKNKDKSHKDAKKSDSQRIAHSGKFPTSDSKSIISDDNAKKYQLTTSTKNNPPDTAVSKHKPSQINPLIIPEIKHDRDRSKSKISSVASAETKLIPENQQQNEKSSPAINLSSSKYEAAQSDKIVYNREGTKPIVGSDLQKTDLTGSSSGNTSHRQSAEVLDVKRHTSSSGKEVVKRLRSSPSTAGTRDSKRSKLDVPEKRLRQVTDSTKEGLRKDTEPNISGTGAKGDLYVSVKLAAIKRNVAGGKFQVEGLTSKGHTSNPSQTKRSVHFGGVQKFYIERRKKVRFAKVVATYKWPMSRKVKFVKLKKSGDSTKSKKTHKRKKPSAVGRQQKKKSTDTKSKENEHTLLGQKSISWQENQKAQKHHTGSKLNKVKPLTSSKNVKSNDPENIPKTKTPKQILVVPTDSLKQSFDDALQGKCNQPKVEKPNDNSKPKTDKILPSGPGTAKTEKLGKYSVSAEMTLEKNSSRKRREENKKERKRKSKKASKLSTVKSVSKQKQSMLWKIPKKLKIKRLKVAISKKIQKKSVYLLQIKRLTRVVKIEKAIRRLTRSVNKLTKPKDLLKIAKEIKRLIKIKTGLIKLNKTLDEKLVKRAKKAKNIKNKGVLKKKKEASRKASSQAKQLPITVKKSKGKSDKSSNEATKKISNKASVDKNKPAGKSVKSSKTTQNLLKSKDNGTKKKIIGDKSLNVEKGIKEKPSDKKTSKLSTTEEVSQEISKNSSRSKNSVLIQEPQKILHTSSGSKIRSRIVHPKKSKSKSSKKIDTKVTTRWYWKSKKTSKEIKRCIRKLHENFYTAKYKGVAQRKRTRKSTRSERKIENKKIRVRNINLKINQMQRVLKQHKDVKTLGRKQLLNFANNKRLKPFSVRSKTLKKSTNFRCLLMGQSYKMRRNLDCAHFRMIHDTQNVCVVKSRWGEILQIKSEENKCSLSKNVKQLKRLKSNYIECFRNAQGAKVSILTTVNKSALPFHLNAEKIYPLYSEFCTTIHATRPNGFGYFYCPNPLLTKIVKRRRNSEGLSKMEILLIRKSVDISCKIKKNSKKSILQSLLKRKPFPFEKMKLPPGQESSLGIINKSQKLNAIKTQKPITLPGAKTKKLKAGIIAPQKSVVAQNALKTASALGKSKKPVSGRKVSVLLKKAVMPSKRRVLCQKYLVSQHDSSHPILKPSLKSVSKERETFRSKAKKQPSCRWFLRKNSLFLGHNPRFFLLKKPAVVSKWVLRRKKLVGQPPRIFLVKKCDASDPKWTLLKSTSNGKAKLVPRKHIVKSDEKRSCRKIGLISGSTSKIGKRRDTKKKILLFKKVVVPGKPPRVIIRRKTVPQDFLRRKEVLLGHKKPRILIKKRRKPGGRTQIVIYRESVPGKKGKQIKAKIYAPGVEPKIFVQKAMGQGQKPRIILSTPTQSHLKSLQKQIEYTSVQDKEKFVVIRRELVSGKVIRINNTPTLSVSKSKPKLFLRKDLTGMPKPLIIKKEWSFNNTIQYIINRECLMFRTSRFVIQQGNKSQVMLIKKLVPGKEPEIIMRKVLVSEKESKFLKSTDSSRIEDIQSKTPVFIRKLTSSSPPPFLIMNKTVEQKSQVLVRREFVEKYKPVVSIRKQVMPGQKPQVVIRTEKPITNKNIISAKVVKNILPQNTRLQRHSKNRRKLVKRSYTTIPKRWSSFHYSKQFFRKQILSQMKKKVALKKNKQCQTFKIFAGRSRVLTDGLLRQNRNRRALRRRKAAKRRKTKGNKLPFIKQRASHLRNPKMRKFKMTKRTRGLICQKPSISVRNVRAPGKKPKLQIRRKLVPGKNSSMCVLVTQTKPGQKPQIIIRRLPPQNTKICRRPLKTSRRKGIAHVAYSESHRRKTTQLQTGKELITLPRSGHKLITGRTKVLNVTEKQVKENTLLNQKVQPLQKKVKRSARKSVGVGSSSDNKNETTFTKQSSVNQDDGVKSQVQLLQKEIMHDGQQKGDKLAGELMKGPQQMSSLGKINPAKRKFSKTSPSPETDKRVSKKQRTGVKPSIMLKPLKRINSNIKSIHSQGKSKRKKKTLNREFPNLLNTVVEKLHADYLKNASNSKDKSKGKSIFKVPKVPKHKREVLPKKSDIIQSKKTISNTSGAQKIKMSGSSDTPSNKIEVGKTKIGSSTKEVAPPVATVSTTEQVSSWQSYRERPKFLFANKTGEITPRQDETRKSLFDNMEASTSTFNRTDKPSQSGNSSVSQAKRVFFNSFSSESETSGASCPSSLRDNRVTDSEKKLIAAGLTGFPNIKSNSRPKSPPEPIPAIWALPRVPRFPKTTVTSLLEKIARKNATINNFGAMDVTDGAETIDREDSAPIINEDLSDNEEESHQIIFDKDRCNALMAQHSISDILKKKRFALGGTNIALSKVHSVKLLEEVVPLSEYIPKIVAPLPTKEIAPEPTPPPAPLPPPPPVEPKGKQKSVVHRGTEMDSAMTSPEDMDSDSNNIFLESSPNGASNSGVFKEEPIFSIRESENDFFIESTTNVGTQFDKVLYRKSNREKSNKLLPNMILPPMLVRHTMSSFQKSVSRFKQNKMFKIATFARKRAEKLALRKKSMLKRATCLNLKKNKRKLKRRNKQKSGGTTFQIPGRKRKDADRKIQKGALKVRSKRKVSKAKPATGKSNKRGNKSSTQKKVVLKSILKKPSFGMKNKYKVAPLKVLPKDFVLKSILKKKKVYPSHPGVAREASSDTKLPEPLKSNKKKIVISSILSPVPMHSDRKHSRCKHFKGLKIAKKSKSSQSSGHSRSSDGGRRSESSSGKHRHLGLNKSSFVLSVAGCSKDVASALPRIQATSTIFKVPAIPPASSKGRVTLPASSGSSSLKNSSTSSSSSSSTYIAPPASKDLSLSGILSSSFKVPESPPDAKQSKKRHHSSTSTSHSSKRRKHFPSPPTHKGTTSTSSPTNTADQSPGYSTDSITLASLLKSSEFPVSKDSSHFKALQFDWSSKPVSQTTESCQSQSQGKNLSVPVTNPQDPTAEVKRISVPTKAQLKQVSPQPHNVDSKISTESGDNIVVKDTKKDTPSSSILKSEKGNRVGGKTPSSKFKTHSKTIEKETTTKIAERIPQKSHQSKKVSFDKKTVGGDKNRKIRKTKPVDLATMKISPKEKKLSAKKKDKHKVRKCGHPKEKKRGRKVTKSSEKVKATKKLKQKNIGASKPAKKVQFAKPELKKTIRKKREKKKGPRFNVRYAKDNVNSMTRNRIRILTSLYYKYEENITRINKIRRNQLNINQQKITPTLTCPNFLQELHYWKKVQLSKKFTRRLGVFRQKYFEGTKKIMAKNLCNKQSIAYNSSKLLAQKVLMKYGKKRLLSRKTSKSGSKGTSRKGLSLHMSKSAHGKNNLSRQLIKRKSLKSGHKGNIVTKGRANQNLLDKVSRKSLANVSQLTKSTNKNVHKKKSEKSVSKHSWKLDKEKLPTGKHSTGKTIKKLMKPKTRESGRTEVSNNNISKKIRRISTNSKSIVKTSKRSIVSQKRRKAINTLRLLKQSGKFVAIPSEKQMPLTTMFVPKGDSVNPNVEMAKPFVVVSAKEMMKLNKLRKVIHTGENTGIIKDWLSFMVSSFKKPPPTKLIQTSELISRVPTNCYIIHSIQLQKHKRELDDRITDLKEKGLAMKIGSMPKLPPVPKGFVEEETTPMDKETVENAITQRLCLSIAHGGFTHSNVNAVEALSLAVQQFYKNFCKNLKETVHRSNSHLSIGFPDAMDRVLTDKGFGGVRGLEDYYNTEIIARHKSLQNIAALKRVEYASILRSSIALPAHIPVTTEDFAANDSLEPSSDVTASSVATGKSCEENPVANPNQLPGDKGILELIYELETDVLKSSQNIMCHEVIRPRFLEYQEPTETAQKRLEIVSVPIVDQSETREGDGSHKSNAEQEKEKVEAEKLEKQKSDAKVLQASLNQSAALMIINALRNLSPIEKQMFEQWQKMVTTLKQSTSLQPTVSVMGKEVPKTNPLSAEHTLFAKAIDLKARLALTLRDPKHDQAARDNIVKYLDPRIVQFLKMAEVARKVGLIARRSKFLQESIRAMASSSKQPQNLGQRVLDRSGKVIMEKQPALSTTQQSSSSSTASAAIPSKSVLGTANSSNKPLQRLATNAKPQSKVETQTSPTKPISKCINLAQAKVSQEQSQRAKQLQQLPGTSQSSTNQRLKALSSVHHKSASVNPQPLVSKTSGSMPRTKPVTKNEDSKKQMSLFRTNAKGHPKTSQATGRKTIRHSLKKYKGKYPTFSGHNQRKLSKEVRRVNLFLRISSFIRRLPKETRVTALMRNPNLVRALGNQPNLVQVLKENPKLVRLAKFPRNRKTIFDRKTRLAKNMSLQRNQIKVYDRKLRNVKIATLKGNQWKSRTAKGKSKKITTLKRNRGVCRNPITKEQKIVTVDTEHIQIINITKNRMKIVYPNSNEEKVVFMNHGQVTTTSQSKTKTVSLKSNQTRITDVNRNDSKIISMKRKSGLKRKDAVHSAPSNRVTVLDPKTRQLKSIHLTINQVATIDPKTRKIKIRNLKSNEVKVLDPITKTTQIVTLKPNQIKVYDPKTKTIRIINAKPDQVLDPITKKLRPLNLKANQVTVVNPITKKVKIVNIDKVKSMHSHSMNINVDKNLQKECLMLNPDSDKVKRLAPHTTKISVGRISDPDNKSVIALSKTPPDISMSFNSKKTKEGRKTLSPHKPQESIGKIPDKYLKISRTGSSVQTSQLTSAGEISTRSSELSAKALITYVQQKSSDAPLQSNDSKSDFAIRKPLAGEPVGKPVNVLPIHPSTSLLRPVNPNLPQFSKTSLIQVGPNSSKVGTSLSSRALPSNLREMKSDIPTLSPSSHKAQQSKLSFNPSSTPHLIQGNLLTKTQQIKSEGVGNFTAQKQKHGMYSQDSVFNVKSGGGVSGTKLPVTPIHPLLTTRMSQGLDRSSDSSTQHLKVAYRVPQATMAPVIPHSSLTIISSGEHPLMFDASKQSSLSQTKVAFSSSSVLGRSLQSTGTTESVVYNLSPTREVRKGDKAPSRSSSSSSSLKTPSRHSESSSSKDKSSKSSKSSSRSSDSKSSRSTKEKDKGSSRSSDSKSSSSGSSKSSSKHHESKHSSSSSSKSHREPSPAPKKSKHHKSHEVESPEPKQPAKRGRPPKRPAPTTPPKKTKGSRHSTPDPTNDSATSRKHAKHH